MLDACSIINLINGGCIDKVVSASYNDYFVGDVVLEHEMINPLQRLVIQALITKGHVGVLRSSVPFSTVIAFQEKYNLGIGETECIVLCKKQGYAVCSDDRKASKTAIRELGSGRVLTSLRLLKDAVANTVLLCAEAIECYSQMLEKGGFLPTNLDESYFCQ